MIRKINNKVKLFIVTVGIILAASCYKNVMAASSYISASSNTVNVGGSVSINVGGNAAAWNVHISGAGISDSVVGFDSDGNNTNYAKSFLLNTSTPGTYTVYISGDITDENGQNIAVSDSVSVVVKEAQNTTNNSNANNSSSNSNNNNNNNNNRTYNTVVDTRSSNARLSSLNIEGINLDQEFLADVVEYTASVDFSVNELNISAIPEDDKSTIVIDGNLDLVTGENTVKITVTAENGSKKVYTIVVNKEKNPDDINAFLSSIIINNATLKSEFNPEIYEYMCDDISADIDKLDLVITTKIEGATYEITGNDELVQGINHISIKVKSKDGSEEKEYKIIVYKTDEILSIKEEPQEKEKLTLKEFIKNNLIYVIMYGFILVEFVIIVVLFAKLNKLKKKIKINDIKGTTNEAMKKYNIDISDFEEKESVKDEKNKEDHEQVNENIENEEIIKSTDELNQEKLNNYEESSGSTLSDVNEKINNYDVIKDKMDLNKILDDYKKPE